MVHQILTFLQTIYLYASNDTLQYARGFGRLNRNLYSFLSLDRLITIIIVYVVFSVALIDLGFLFSDTEAGIRHIDLKQQIWVNSRGFLN